MSNEDNHGLNYLAQATEILLQWKISGNSGLINEAFTACLQGMRAMPSLAKYLLYKHGFEYVSLGKFMSDPIEGRFGWYRQANGANIFISTSGCFRQKKNLLFKLAATAGYIISFPVDHGKFFTSVWKKRRRIMAHGILIESQFRRLV